MAEVTAEVVTPVEVPAAEAAPVPESTADQGTAAPEGDKPIAPERTFTQAELDAINAKTKAQAERRALKAAARVEAERDVLRQQLEDLRKPAQQQPQDGAPKPEDFNGNYEKWLIAQAKYELREELKQRDQQSTAQRDAQASQQVIAQRRSLLDERLDSAADEYPDIRELVQSDALPFTEPMTAAVLELEEYGGKVMGYLATHPDEAAKIAKLSPVRQVLAFDALGKKLTAAPRPTPTPAPIVPNSGRAPVEKRLEETTSYEEFNAIRKRQIAARKGAWK